MSEDKGQGSKVALARQQVEQVLVLKGQGVTLAEAVARVGMKNISTYYYYLKRFGLENPPPRYETEPALPTEDDVPPDVDVAYPVGKLEALTPDEHAEKHARVAAEYGKGMPQGIRNTPPSSTLDADMIYGPLGRYLQAKQSSRMRIAQLAGELVTVQAATGGQVRVRWAKEAGTDSGNLCDLSQLKDIAAELLEAHALMERGGAGGSGGNG